MGGNLPSVEKSETALNKKPDIQKSEKHEQGNYQRPS
jgi:hypothetical protein